MQVLSFTDNFLQEYHMSKGVENIEIALKTWPILGSQILTLSIIPSPCPLLSKVE